MGGRLPFVRPQWFSHIYIYQNSHDYSHFGQPAVYPATCQAGVFIFASIGCLFVGVFRPSNANHHSSAHSWQLYSTAPLGEQAISAMTRNPTPSHYPDTETTIHCPILVKPSTGLCSDKDHFDNSSISLSQVFKKHGKYAL